MIAAETYTGGVGAFGYVAADEVHVAAQDARLHVVGADHVVRHQQEPLAGQPTVVLRDHPSQFRDRAGGRVALQDQVQHGHEMALAATEAAVQVDRLAAAVLDRRPDQDQRLVEVLGQLFGDDVVVNTTSGRCDVLDQPQDKVALLDPFRDFDQFFDDLLLGRVTSVASLAKAMQAMSKSVRHC
jgi:hypothetical protein